MVDLHMHTHASDGTDSTEKLLKKLRSAGIKTFSVTDHDTIDGICSMEYWGSDDMVFIRGIEVSCVTEARNCHHGISRAFFLAINLKDGWQILWIAICVG